MRAWVIVAVAAAVAIAAYVTLGRRPVVRGGATPGAITPPSSGAPAAAPRPTTVSDAVVAPPPAAVVATPAAADTRGADASADVAPPRHERATEGDDDRLSRRELRTVVERAFKGKLHGRELTPQEYDRLTDAVLRLRTAVSRMRRAAASPSATTELEERDRVAAAMREIESITGVPPSDLGDVLTPGDDGTP